MSKKYGKTGSQVNFASAVHANIPRSVFRQNHSHKTAFNASELIPVFIQEVLPGDTFEIDMSSVVRTTTPIVPAMDNLYLQAHFFFVPNRLVWDGHEELHGENKESAWIPLEAPALVPCLAGTSNALVNIPVGSNADYLGIPPGDYNFNVDSVTGEPFELPISALPFRGIGLIYNEWYRDQNYQAPLNVPTGDFDAQVESTEPWAFNKPPLRVNKIHDYFTSVLPAPQKSDGVLAVSVDGTLASGFAPVVTRGIHPATGLTYNGVDALPRGAIPVIPGTFPAGRHSRSAPLYWGTTDGSTSASIMRYAINAYGDPRSAPNNTSGWATGQLLRGEVASVSGPSATTFESAVPMNLWADLSRASGEDLTYAGTTISELRTAFQVQRLFERDARGGTRYTEMLKAHWSVMAEDMRLQRPEFLGSWRQELERQQVPQTSETSATPQGNMACYSFTPITKKRCVRKSFVEHGFVIGLVNVRSKKTYQEGIERFWSRRDRFDYYYPALAHISEQPVFTGEIWRNDTGGGATRPTAGYSRTVFGYQESWADYRYKPNRTSGVFRSSSANSLDVWHYGSYFGNTQPIMSGEWLVDDTREMLDRNLVLPHTTAPQILADFYFSNKATRPLPFHGVPGLVDHF